MYRPKEIYSHLWARVGNPALVALNLDDGGGENAFHAANLNLEAKLRRSSVLRKLFSFLRLFKNYAVRPRLTGKEIA